MCEWCDIQSIICFAGNRPHSVDACERVEHSDLDDSARSGSSESEYASDGEQKTKHNQV